MAIAAPAADLDANHSVACVLEVADVVRVEGLEKTRPSSSGFELGGGSKQGQAAQPAAVHAVLLVIQKATAKGRLGPMIQQNPPFLGTEPLGQAIALGGAE
jgi:hypothetical protein